MSGHINFDVTSQVYTDDEGRNWITVLTPVWFTEIENLEEMREALEENVKQWFYNQTFEPEAFATLPEGEGPGDGHNGTESMQEETNGDQSRNGETE